MSDRQADKPTEPTSPLLILVRYVLPIAVVVVGATIFLLDPHVNNMEGSAALIGAGLSVLLLNVLYRAGVRGDVDRDDEEAARRYFDAHGYWPDEAPRPDAPEAPRPDTPEPTARREPAGAAR